MRPLPIVLLSLGAGAMSIHDHMKEQGEAIKDDKKKTEALVATSERAQGDLKCIIGEAVDDLARLSVEYVGLLLTG